MRNSFRDKLDCSLNIRPVFTLKAIENYTRVAIFLSETLFKHSSKDLGRKVSIFCLIYLRLFVLTLLFGLFLLLLLGKSNSKFFLSLFEVLGCLFGYL